MRIYDFPKYPKTQNPKTFASCKLFLKIIYKSLTAHSESSLGGLEGRLERITKNPRADGQRDYKHKSECKLFIKALPEQRR